MECKVGVGALSQSVGSRRKPGEGLAGKIWQTGQPLVVDDYDAWSGRVATFQRGLMRAIMGVPLKSGAQVVGVIGLAYGAESSRAFGAEEVELLSRFAQLASVVLDNARLYSAAQETQRRLTDIINFLPDATLVIDGEGRVIAWNRAMEEMTGIPAQEMLGKGDYEYALPFYGERRPILIDLVFNTARRAGAKICPDPATWFHPGRRNLRAAFAGQAGAICWARHPSCATPRATPWARSKSSATSPSASRPKRSCTGRSPRPRRSTGSAGLGSSAKTCRRP